MMLRFVFFLVAILLFSAPASALPVKPNDPLFADQWALTMIHAPEAWKHTVGSKEVTIAIVDSGIIEHPDLRSRIAGGYDFISDPDMAGDGDGRDSDPTDVGDTSPESSGLHGTHIAGIAAARGNNAIGVTGVDWRCRLVVVRVLGVKGAGGLDTDIADGIRWAAGAHVDGVPDNPHPAHVINMSFGSAGRSQVMQDAIDEARARGAILVASAGNADESAAKQSPGGLDGVITVGAVGRTGKGTAYTNYGDAVVLMAPGGNTSSGILSTLAREDNVAAYEAAFGTSEAAAFVSGAISLMKAVYPDLSADEAKRMLVASADRSAQCREGCGAGLLDVDAAVKLAESGGPAPHVASSGCSIGKKSSGTSPLLLLVALAFLRRRRALAFSLLLLGCRPPAPDPRAVAEAPPKDATEEEAPEEESELVRPDSVPGEPSKARYGGWQAATETVGFGEKPKTICNWTVTMKNVVVELDRSPSGNLTGGRVRNRMIEALADECSADPQAPNEQRFELRSTTKEGDTSILAFDGAETNRPRTGLEIRLRTKDGGLEAVATWTRLDLGPPYGWTIKTTIDLVAQVPMTTCFPGTHHCGGEYVLGQPGTLYRCDSSGTTLSFVERCPNACVLGSTNDACE